MFILAIVSAGFVIAAISVTLIRLAFDRRFRAIQQEPDQTVLFRRKLHYLRRIEQARHIRYLFATSLLIGVALVSFIGSFFVLANDYQHTKTENTRLTERIETVEEKQQQLATSIPLKTYPEDGIGLKEYAWDKLTVENKDSGLQEQVESDVSQKLFQYVGTSDTALSLAIPKTLALHLEGQAEDQTSQETIKKNIDAFAKEAEAVPELTQIQVRMITSGGSKKKVVYSVNYSRKTGSEAFNKQNVSEQKLKNDGGKG
ncbi:hypothetical protein A5865_003464 [Enterococcus sp. 12E11_DIV0728]|nr:hypothetical protein A5865_003464 [Enterococcus sp. 12E11_DIV0728]OUZ15723.1 hypothetical protein A5868_000634 [Enterococcus sp. 12F9_DIV0723]